MNKTGIPQVVIEVVLLVLLQGLILSRINVSLGEGIGLPVELIIYPFILIALPLRIHWLAVMLSGFIIGLAVDILVGTPGLHAGASVFTAYIRRPILRALEPGDGYNTSQLPVSRQLFGRWVLRYTAAMMAAHLLFYYSLEAFTFAYLGRILLYAILSFIVSTPIVYGFMLLLRGR